MVDIYGYVCVRNNKGASQPGNQSNMGEDQLGVAQTSQAVTREVKITAKVTNCWGGGNKPDKLEPKCLASGGGGSASPGDSITADPQTCSTQPSCHKGSVSCPGRYINYINHTIPAYTCNDHNAAIGWYYRGPHDHNGHACSSGCTCSTIEEPDGNGGITTRDADDGSCGCSPCGDGSYSTPNHNCTWSWAIYDAISGDDWLGKSGFPDIFL